MNDAAAIIDAINKAWTDRYGGDPVTETKALITRVVKIAEDRDCWMTNAKENQKAYLRLEEKLKEGGSLRMWTGKPYRSKQRVLRESIISEVSMVDITETGIAVNSYAEPCDDFARADGFRDFFELRDWFKATHGLPFCGVVIKWHNAERSDAKHSLP